MAILWILCLFRSSPPSRGVLKKRCLENMQQIYRRTPMPKCDFNKVTKQLYWIELRHGCSPVHLLHIFRTVFPKNTSEGLLLCLLKSFISLTWFFFSMNILCNFSFLVIWSDRSSQRRYSVRKGVLKNFVKFTGIHAEIS